MTAYYNEFDSGAAAWLRELIRRGLIADGDVDERSILDVRPVDLAGFTQCHFFAGIGGWSYALRLAGWPDDKKVWTGSPPCQPFSAAGLGKGRDDERHLAPHFAGLVAACRPPILFGEQVASAAVFGKAAKRAGSAASGTPEWAWLDDLFERLEAAHYACGASDLPAAGVGAPHIRQRTFFGAVRLADAQGAGGRSHVGTIQGSAPEGIRGAQGKDERGACERTGDACDSVTIGRLADCGGIGRGTRGIWHNSGDDGAQLAADGGDDRPDATDSPWRFADWLHCRDDKWRPVGPGTFPLAHGVSARVGRLRGYGNAIVPQAAAEFIGAFSEVTGA